MGSFKVPRSDGAAQHARTEEGGHGLPAAKMREVARFSRVRLTLVIVLAGGALLMLMAGSSGAATSSCNGVQGASATDVVVPPGAVCTLPADTNIAQDVQVQQDGTLIDEGAVIGHNLSANNPKGIAVTGGSVGHDVHINGLTGAPPNGGDNYICNLSVVHDLVVQSGATTAGPFLIGGSPYCSAGNRVGHDLVVQNNAEPVGVANNGTSASPIGHDLTVQNNQPGGATVSGNHAGHNAVCEKNGPTTNGQQASGGSCPTVASKPEVTIKKEQRLEGESTYTSAKLISKLGQTVEYRIKITNTGETTLSPTVTDLKCEPSSGSSSPATIIPGETGFFFCHHTLTETGVYTNGASVTAAESTKETNRVEVEVKPIIECDPEFTKEQRLEGEPAYTKAKLLGKVGQTVEYRIKIPNVCGETTLSPTVTDFKCEPSSGSTTPATIVPGETGFFFCHHTLIETGVYTNVASVTAGEKTKETNKVEVEMAGSP